MKTKLSIIVIFIICINAFTFAQCKFEVNELDKFTKSINIVTKMEILHKDFNSAISFNFCKSDSSLFIKVGLNLTGKVYSIDKGDKLMIICSDSIITLNSSEYKLVSGFTYINYFISQKQFEIIQTMNITDIRIYLIDSFIDKKIELKRAEKILELSKCI